MESKNIYQRINAVMSECDYLQKKQAQQGKGIKYDEVMAMIRELLIKHGIVMVTRQTEMTEVSGVEGTKQKIYQGKYELDLVNIDNPTEKVTHTAFAHGMDGGDKGAGKAHTYAMKTMLVKGFGIETGEDEESRSEKKAAVEIIDDGQVKEIKALLSETNSDLDKFHKAFGISSVEDMKKAQFKRAKEMLEVKKNKQEAN